MRRTLLPLVLLAGCAVGVGSDQKPEPPSLPSGDPAVGKTLDVALTAPSGETARLRWVPGRVTVICSFREVASLEPCRSALARFADRVAVAGVATADPAIPPPAPFRIFLDAGGKKLTTALDLPDEDRVLVVDRQGRVRAVFAPDRTDEVLRRVGELAG
jgi:hypothetical protein